MAMPDNDPADFSELDADLRAAWRRQENPMAVMLKHMRAAKQADDDPAVLAMDMVAKINCGFMPSRDQIIAAIRAAYATQDAELTAAKAEVVTLREENRKLANLRPSEGYNRPRCIGCDHEDACDDLLGVRQCLAMKINIRQVLAREAAGQTKGDRDVL